MKNNVIKLLFLLFFTVDVSAAESLSEPATSLDELFARVLAQTSAESRENERRLHRFEELTDQQETLLKTAMKSNHALEQRSSELNAEIANNEKLLSELENQLAIRLGNFGELFGVARQVAGDTMAQVKHSLISAELTGREAPLQEIVSSKVLPTTDQLRNLWVALLQEQTEQGKVRRFSTLVSNNNGYAETQEVVRVGPFSAFSDAGFLTYDAGTAQFSVLPRQPASRYTSAVSRFLEDPSAGPVTAIIDPSSGAILSLLTEAPSLLERFHQGGVPGYIVSFLALIGLSLGLYRLATLWWLGKKVKRQTFTSLANADNPLGRILKTYEENPHLSHDALELKLEDAVLKEIPKLDRGLNTLKVLAAVAPLIGLLGTVVGMILTFQAITLWGTGEPKIMAGGISQALVTTVQGLVAAIPLLLLHSFASGQARLLQNTLEEQSAGMIAQRAECRYA